MVQAMAQSLNINEINKTIFMIVKYVGFRGALCKVSLVQSAQNLQCEMKGNASKTAIQFEF